MTTANDFDRIEVTGLTFNFVTDGPVPFPGVPGAAIPRRFTAAVRDRANECTAQIEVEVDDGRPRIRTIAIHADGVALTPTSLRRLPIGAYLDGVVTRAVLKVERETESTVRIEPIMDFDEAFKVTNAGKAARRRRQPVTSETLAAVAAAYREAPPRQKSAHVAVRLGVQDGYARQLISRARREGLL